MRDYLPFRGLRVVELSSVLAAPAAGMFFAELGAEVLKIENRRTGGDVTRQWKCAEENKEGAVSAYYRSINWGKQTRMLDLRNHSDREEALNEIERADILLSNFRSGSAEKLGFDYNRLQKRTPNIIYVHLTARDEADGRPGFDVLMQAETGFLSMTGHPGAPPAKLPVALIDVLAGHQIKEAVLIALLERQRTGRGAKIHVSMARSAIGALVNQASNYLNTGVIPGPMGTGHPNISPYGEILTGSDGGKVVLAAGTEAHFRKLCEVLETPSTADDPRFADNATRVKHRNALMTELLTAAARFSSEWILSKLTSRGVPAGRIRNLKEVLSTSPGSDMILHWPDGGKCVGTIAFDIRTAAPAEKTKVTVPALARFHDPFPVLNTGRLRLRNLRTSDADGLLVLRSDRQALQYLSLPEMSHRDEALRFIEQMRRGAEEDRLVHWAITLGNDDRLIGTMCLWNLDQRRNKAEIGYMLLPEYHRQGLMTEALQILISFALDDLGIHRLEAYTNTGNTASIRLLKKSGFKQEGFLREADVIDGRYTDTLIFALLSGDR